MSSRLFSDVKKFVKYIQQRSYLLQALMLSLFIHWLCVLSDKHKQFDFKSNKEN